VEQCLYDRRQRAWIVLPQNLLGTFIGFHRRSAIKSFQRTWKAYPSQTTPSSSKKAPLLGQVFDVEVLQQKLSIGRLFVFAIFVYQPDAVQSILGAVVTHAKLPTDILPPGWWLIIRAN
jgi:hypothetical protein